MAEDPILFSIVVIFVGAALLATLALYARQSLLVAYIILGMLLGPWGAGYVEDPAFFQKMAQIGVIFLLFLLGLDLQPQELLRTLGESTFVTAISSLAFTLTGFLLAKFFGFSSREALLVGGTMMFSSTVIGVKLLPTTALHHQRAGEIMISVLLLQDLVAVLILLLLGGYGAGKTTEWTDLLGLLLALPLLVAGAMLLARYVLVRLIERFDTLHEYIFLLTIGWCLGIAQLAHAMGLSHEIGAFVAGVSLAQSPISLFIVQSLKPVRDFFLVVFFFSVGASLNLRLVPGILLPAAALALAMLLLKPILFRSLLMWRKETPRLATEIGVRLGQISEFSLLVALLAAESAFIGERASYLIQVAMLLTFVVSSSWIVMRYPTPIALNDRLRRD